MMREVHMWLWLLMIAFTELNIIDQKQLYKRKASFDV